MNFTLKFVIQYSVGLNAVAIQYSDHMCIANHIHPQVLTQNLLINEMQIDSSYSLFHANWTRLSCQRWYGTSFHSSFCIVFKGSAKSGNCIAAASLCNNSLYSWQVLLLIARSGRLLSGFAEQRLRWSSKIVFAGQLS